MNENIRVIQKIGQVPMHELVENAAKLGFALVGSPTLVSGTPAQLMIRTGKVASAPQYRLVSKTGEDTMVHQIDQMLQRGWSVYGSMLTGELPTQAMVKGDIDVFPMYGMGSSGVSPGLPEGWTVYVDNGDKQGLLEAKGYTDAEVVRINQANAEMQHHIEQLYAALNSLAPENWQPQIDASEQRAKAHTDELGKVVQTNADKVDAKFESQTTQVDQLWSYTDQKYAELSQQIRGEVTGAKGYTDEQVQALEASVDRQLNDLRQAVNSEFEMLRSEHMQDIARLEERINQMARVVEASLDQPQSSWQ